MRQQQQKSKQEEDTIKNYLLGQNWTGRHYFLCRKKLVQSHISLSPQDDKKQNKYPFFCPATHFVVPSKTYVRIYHQKASKTNQHSSV